LLLKYAQSRVYVALAATRALIGRNKAGSPVLLHEAPPIKQGQQVAILVPHPDDEVIGCYHLLQWAKGFCSVDLYYVTEHGEEKVAELRSSESAQALRNVTYRHSKAWHLSDEQLDQQRDQLRDLLRELVGKYDFFICPAPNDATSDHAVIGAEAQKIFPLDRLIWYRSTSWTFPLPTADFACMGERDEKLAAIKVFHSQRNIALQSGVYMSSAEAHHFGVKARSIEAFQLATTGLLAGQTFNTLSLNATIKLSGWLCEYSK